MTAHNILERAAQHMRDRAAAYDKPEGERSMSATVLAFQAVTGRRLTEEQGWLFMALLKAVRSQQGVYRADSYEDGAAYFALAGESACNERNGGWTPEAIDAAAFRPAPDLLVIPDDVVIPDWVEWIGVNLDGEANGFVCEPKRTPEFFYSIRIGESTSTLWQSESDDSPKLYKRTPEGFELMLD